VQPADPFGLIGQVLDGQFRVDRFVGEGGFSTVYRGLHIGLNEPIAVKCLKLPPRLGSALVESFVQRFRDESRIHYRLPQGHLHIARSIASGTMTSPTTSALIPYMVLEWLEGQSLADLFAQRRASGQSGRSLVDVVRLLDSAADALAYAHAQGVVHRDFNPGNLFLASTQAGPKLKVLDFGIAKIMDDSTIAFAPVAKTLGNVRMFTPAYGAPEQFDSRVGTVGPWTDVYSLALVVLEALTDRSVMTGETIADFASAALSTDHRISPTSMGLSLGSRADDAISKALALFPSARPQDAGQFWGLLKNAMRADDGSHVSVETQRLPFSSAPQETTGPVRTLVMSRTSSPPPVANEALRASAPLMVTSRVAASEQPIVSRAPLSEGPAAPRPVRHRGSVVLWAGVGVLVFALLVVTWWLWASGRLR
jgi:serine/threonine protein kinase